ncbi:hypothetical protein SNEBB_002989 [Seison nebaliae]|nr:hypothetical protein SNEBB_002989 [Seison nebaliae]
MQIYQVKYVESISNYAIAGQYYDMDAMYNYRTNSFYIQPEILITTSATPNDHFDKLSYNAREDFEDFFVKWKTRIKRIEITSRKGNISLIEKSLRQFRPLLLEMAKLNTPLQILSHEYMHLLQSQLSSTFPNTICHFDHVQFSQKSILRQIIRKVKMRNNHDKYRTYLQQSVEETLADTCSVQLIYNIFWKQIIDIGKDLMNISKHFQNFYEFLIKTFLFSLFSTRCWHESQFDYFGYDIIHESSMDRVQTLFDYSNDEWKSIFGCSPNTTNSVYHISKNISNKPISIFFAQFFNKSSESVNMDSCILSGIDF